MEINEYNEKINSLWSILQTPQEQQEQFLSEIRDDFSDPVLMRVFQFSVYFYCLVSAVYPAVGGGSESEVDCVDFGDS